MAINNNLNINIKINSDDKPVKELNKNLGDTEKVTYDLAKATQKATEESEKHSKQLLNVAENLTQIGVSLGKLSFNAITDPLQEAGEKAKSFAIGLGATATAASAVETIIAKNLLHDFTSLNSEMANVNSVLLQSPKNFDNLNEKVRDLSLSLKLATETDIAKGLYDVGSSGFNGAEGIQVLDTAIKSSKAGRADLRESSMLIAQTLNAMGKNSTYAEQTANILFKTVQRGVLEFKDLASGLGDLTANLKSLGQPLEVAGAALALETRKGTSPQKAITNLNSLLLSFAAQSEQSKKMAEKLGIQMDSNAIKAKGFATVLEDVIKAAKGTGDLNGTLFTLLGRQEALNAALQLSNAKEFRNELKEMENSSTALSDSLGEQTKSLETQFQNVQVGLKAIKTEAGSLVGQLVSKFLPSIEGVISDFNNLSEGTRKAILVFGAVVASIPAVVAGFGAVTLGIGLLVAQLVISRFLFTVLLDLLKPLTSIVLALGSAMKSAALSAYAWATGTSTANSALVSLRTTLLATVSTLGAYLLILGSAAIAVGALTLAVIKLDQAQEEQRKNEKRNYDSQAEAIKKINELRKKEQGGDPLTSKEQEDYAKALVSMTNVNSTLRAEAQKRIKISKDLANQEKETTTAINGYTDEQIQKRKDLFDSILDAEFATKADLEKAKREAQKQKDEELDKLKQALTSKLITEKEFKEQSLKVELTYNALIKKATDKYNEEIERKRKDVLKKKQELANFESELASNINKNTSKNEFDIRRNDAFDTYKKRYQELNNLEGESAKTKLLIEKEYQSTLTKIKEDEKKANQDRLKKEKEESERTAKEIKDIKKSEKDFTEKIADDITKINATEQEKARIDLKATLKDLYDNYELIKEKMSTATNSKGIKLFSSKDIANFSKEFSNLYKEIEIAKGEDIAKIGFAKPIFDDIDKIKLELEGLNDIEYSSIGERIQAEKDKWEKINKITKDALKQKESMTKEDSKKLEEIEKEAKKNITKDDKELLKTKLDGNKRLAESIKTVASEFDFLDSKTIGASFSLLEFGEDGVRASESLYKSLEVLKKDGLEGLTKFAQGGGDLTGLQTYFQLAVEASKKFLKAIQDNIRELKNLDDIGSFTSDVAGDLVNNLTFGASGAVDKYFGKKTFAEKKKEAIELKELQISMMQDRKAMIDAQFNNEMEKIKATSDGYELKEAKIKKLEQEREKDLTDFYEKEKELAEKLHSEKMALAVELSRLGHKLQEVNNNEADNLILKAQDDLLELETTKDSLQVKELKRLEIIQTLQESLKKMKEDYFSDISSLMSKYYEKELTNIKGNHKAEYDLIRVNENKIKDNQDKINSLNEELDKINKEFDKRLSDKNLSAEASKSFANARNNLMSANGGNDLTALVRMSPSELERSIASQKEEIDLEYAKTGNLEKRSEALKALAVKQNVYWSELAKTLVKGTKEYDSYIKNANDGFREYKSSVKDSIEVQKENRLETSKLTQQIESLTSENKTLQSQVTQANNTVNKDIENLTAKFKSSTGEWITDINKARTALQGLSVDSQAAIASLNKIQSNNTSASQNVSGLTSAGLGTPKTPEALATFKDALPNETMSAYIARVTKEDAQKEQDRLNFIKSSQAVSTTPKSANIYGSADFSNSKPIAQSSTLASATINSATTTDKGWFDKGGALGFINPMNWFADGGIANGSTSGYPAMLHGKELVLNQNQGDNLSYILRMANSKPNMVNNNSSSVIFAPTINGTNLTQKELETTIKNVYASIQKDSRRAY